MDKELLAKSLNVAKSAARALWSCCRNSQRCRVAVLKTGGVPFLAKLVSLENEDILVPVTGLIQECCVEVRYMSFWYYVSQYSVSPVTSVNFIFCRSIPFLSFLTSRKTTKTCRLRTLIVTKRPMKQNWGQLYTKDEQRYPRDSDSTFQTSSVTGN